MSDVRKPEQPPPKPRLTEDDVERVFIELHRRRWGLQRHVIEGVLLAYLGEPDIEPGRIAAEVER